MRSVVCSLVLGTVLVAATVASGDPPSAYRLYQNDPNPFCSDSIGQRTEIRFDIPAEAHIRVVVGDADGIIVMRTLVNQVLGPGYYLTYWDGRDDWGGYMATERYPYSLQERDPDTGRWTAISRRHLTIDCSTVAGPTTWGRIKALYRPCERPTAN